MIKYKKINLDEFLNLFNDTKEKFINESGEKSFKNFQNIFKKIKLSYKKIDHEKEKEIILQILKKNDIDTQRIAEEYRTNEWEKGWEENLNKFILSDKIEDLTPEFTRKQKFIRYKQNIVEAESELFERDFVKVLQNYLIFRYIINYDNCYEFGCGSCINLIEIAKNVPNIKLFGTDFVESPIKIIEHLNKKHFNNRISGEMFNMISPNTDYEIKENSCVITIGAIEQLASKYNDFIDFLIEKKPSLCIHIEPIYEFYDENNLLDFITMKFHKKRNYSMGLFNKLIELEKENKIEIIRFARTNIGSLNMEGYNSIVWRAK